MNIPGQSHPHRSHPSGSTFFTPNKVRDTIDPLQFGKPQDPHGLAGEQIIYVRDTLLLLLAHICNRAICEGFPTSWTEHTIVTKLKSGDPMMLVIAWLNILVYSWSLYCFPNSILKYSFLFSITFLSLLISKEQSSMPHDIIRVEMKVDPMITEAVFQSVTNIQQLLELPK